MTPLPRKLLSTITWQFVFFFLDKRLILDLPRALSDFSASAVPTAVVYSSGVILSFGKLFDDLWHLSYMHNTQPSVQRFRFRFAPVKIRVGSELAHRRTRGAAWEINLISTFSVPYNIFCWLIMHYALYLIIALCKCIPSCRGSSARTQLIQMYSGVDSNKNTTFLTSPLFIASSLLLTHAAGLTRHSSSISWPQRFSGCSFVLFSGRTGLCCQNTQLYVIIYTDILPWPVLNA